MKDVTEFKKIDLKIKQLLAQERYAEIIPLASKLVSAGEPWWISGYMFRGYAFEMGGQGVDPDLDRAISDYRQLAVISPSVESYIYLARALMGKNTPSDYASAYNFLVDAQSIRNDPEVMLGFAEFFRRNSTPDYGKARRFYLKAAIRGRFAGFFGFASMSRELGQPGAALFADCARVLLGPVIALLIGSRARYRF